MIHGSFVFIRLHFDSFQNLINYACSFVKREEQKKNEQVNALSRMQSMAKCSLFCCYD